MVVRLCADPRCRKPLVQRPGEHPSNFKKRQTCANPRKRCVVPGSNARKLPPDNEAWWLPIEELPRGLTLFSDADVPREPPLRLARPTSAERRQSVGLADFLSQPEAGL